MKAQDTSVALLISTYNWPEALGMVFESILRQSRMPDEIIIADDGSGQSTTDMIDAYRPLFPVPVKHYWQQDKGFRKTAIINHAIANTSCNYIIQIDGDILLSDRFVEDHLRVSEGGHFIRGSRVLLSQVKSKKTFAARKITAFTAVTPGIQNRFNAFRLPFLAGLFIKKTKKSNNIHGSNCAYWRSDFVNVNGYNNNMKGWGHEDIELAARFVNAGLHQKKVKMLGVCYHMYHTFNDRGRAEYNYSIYEQTVKSGLITCSNGYQQIKDERKGYLHLEARNAVMA